MEKTSNGFDYNGDENLLQELRQMQNHSSEQIFKQEPPPVHQVGEENLMEEILMMQPAAVRNPRANQGHRELQQMQNSAREQHFKQKPRVYQVGDENLMEEILMMQPAAHRNPRPNQGHQIGGENLLKELRQRQIHAREKLAKQEPRVHQIGEENLVAARNANACRGEIFKGIF